MHIKVLNATLRSKGLIVVGTVALGFLLALYMALLYQEPILAQTTVQDCQVAVAGNPFDVTSAPEAILIINAFDGEGTMLQWDRFRQTVDDFAWATDLKGLPLTRAIRNDSSSPAFIIVTQTPYQVHILWEVPEFGKVVLHADNEGKGYLIDKQGGKLVLNFNYEAAKSTLYSLQKDFDLCLSQGYTLSNSVGEGVAEGKKRLRAAEDYLSKTPSADMKSAVAELNSSLKSSLWAHEQLQLDRAKLDIERYRKGEARLKVADKEGKPLVNGAVSFKQASHDFLFGANPMGKNNKYSETYARLSKEAGINYSYIISSWKSLEPMPGKFGWGVIESYQSVSAQLNMGFRLMGGLSMWFYRGSGLGDDFSPTYQDTMTFEELKQNIYNHMYALASRYRGKIDTWEINEQNQAWANVLNLTWNQKLETYDVFARAVKDADPKAKVLHDSNALPYEFNYTRLDGLDTKANAISFPEFLALLIQKQSPLDIIGLEFYYGGANTDGYRSPGLDLDSISNLLDQYSSFGKPVFVRELSAPSTQVGNSSWWHKTWNEQTQAEYLEKFYTIAFSKPLVQEIGWSYGVSDEDAYLIGGGLLDTNLKPKPSYFALKNLINSWTTSGTGRTNEKGEFEFRGFAGDYELTLETSIGQTFKKLIHVNEQHTNEVTVQFSPAQQEPKPIPSPEPERIPFPKVATVPAEPQTTVTPPPEEAPSLAGNNIWLIAGAVGGILVVGLLTLVVIRRKARG